MSDDFFAGRELCPDGACIGIIGPDGLCRECGRVGNSAITDPRLRNLTPESPADAATDADDIDSRDSADAVPDAAPGPADNPASPTGESPDDDFAARALCPDGGCIGLLDEHGKCKVCGLLAE